jgi:hypothetical protein
LAVDADAIDFRTWWVRAAEGQSARQQFADYLGTPRISVTGSWHGNQVKHLICFTSGNPANPATAPDNEAEGPMEATLQGAAHGSQVPRGLRGLRGFPGARESLRLCVALALLSCLPFLVTAYPQLTDYPSHLASYYVMLDGGSNPWLARYYDFHWMWTGNLGADILIWPLAKIFGLERAGWLIGAMIPPLTGLGLVAVDWVLHRRVGIGALLAMTTIWSPAMGMGFYNFCLALALALFAFALWVHLERWRWRPAVFLPIGVLVWLCHLAGWGVLGLLVFGYEWSRNKSFAAFIAPWPLMLPFIALLTGPEAKGALSYGEHVVLYKEFIWLQALRLQSFNLDVGLLGLLGLVFLGSAVLGRIDGRLGWAALLLLIATIAIPRHLGGGDYADYRLIAVALMIGSLAITWRVPRWLFWAAPALFLVRIGLTTVAWREHSQELQADLGALDYIPRGAKVAGVVVVDEVWPLNPFEHAPSYAVIRRDALVNSLFAVPGVHMLQLKEGGKYFVDPYHRILHWPGAPIDLADYIPAREAQYLWYFGREQPDSMPPGARVIYRTPQSFLARLANRPGPR